MGLDSYSSKAKAPLAAAALLAVGAACGGDDLTKACADPNDPFGPIKNCGLAAKGSPETFFDSFSKCNEAAGGKPFGLVEDVKRYCEGVLPAGTAGTAGCFAKALVESPVDTKREVPYAVFVDAQGHSMGGNFPCP